MDENKDYEIEDREKDIPEDIYLYKSSDEIEKKKKRGFRGSLFSYIALALVASIIGGVISIYVGPSLYGSILPNPNSNQYTSQPVNINTTDDINTVSAVVKKAMSSVVGITTLETRQFLFQEQDVEGLGSGVIVNSDGYILTNSHVVANGNAKEIKVLFDNGDKVPGRVLWSDPSIDLAMVKVDITNLPVAELGDSDNLEVGEIAIAIGNPLGLEFERTVTSGIISGLHRSVRMDQTTVIDDLIQTDASINPGNSGGPLLNKRGEVVGINTAKIKSAEGLGFSIPINSVKTIVKDVIDKGVHNPVMLGIRGLDIEEYQLRLGIDLGLEEGIIILQVDENTSAAKAGLLPGDVVMKVDNKDVESMQSLKNILYKYSVGDKANLKIIRNGEEKEIEVVFQEEK
ncbi:serine protease HtrA [Tissierellaceae bacterium HCP3S3_D8]